MARKYTPRHQQRQSVTAPRVEKPQMLVSSAAPAVQQAPVKRSTAASPPGERRARERNILHELTPGTPAQKRLRVEKAAEIAAERIRIRKYRRSKGL